MSADLETPLVAGWLRSDQEPDVDVAEVTVDDRTGRVSVMIGGKRREAVGWTELLRETPTGWHYLTVRGTLLHTGMVR